MSTVLLLRFEEPAGVQSADATGNLKDLWISAFGGGLLAAEPAVAIAWAGGGRTFDGAATALLNVDADDGNTLLQRDVSIVSLLSLTLTGMTDPMTVVARGCATAIDDEQAISYGLQLQAQPDFPGYVEVRMFWSASDGTRKLQPAGVFEHPGDGKEFMLTATRRWESSSRVVIRYLVNHELIAEVVSTDGDIGGDTTYYTVVGAELETDTGLVNFFKGTIDQLQVLDLEVSPQEVRQLWRRLTEHQPGGVETMIGLLPPGLDSLARNTASNEGRKIKVAGEALGFAVATTDDLRELWLPDQTTLVHMPRWEKLKGLTAKPRQSLDSRRERLLALFARQAGYSVPAIQIALAELFDQLAPDVEIVEFTNEFVDNFAGSSLNDARWLAGEVGAWIVASDHLELHIDSAEDLSWQKPTGYPGHLRMSLDRGDDIVFMQAALVDWGALPANAGVGIYMHDRRVHDLFWFGVYNNGAATKIAHRSVDHRTEGAFVELVDAPAGGPLWLRMRTDNNPAGPKITVSYSTDGVAWTDTDVFTGLGERVLDWGGLLTISTGAITADIDVIIDNYLAWCPGAVLPFCWYAYRDPALAGEVDLIGAHLVVQKVKPAHTHGAAIMSKELLADDPRDGLSDWVPVGGFDDQAVAALPSAPGSTTISPAGIFAGGIGTPAVQVASLAMTGVPSAGAVGAAAVVEVLAPSGVAAAGGIGAAELDQWSLSVVATCTPDPVANLETLNVQLEIDVGGPAGLDQNNLLISVFLQDSSGIDLTLNTAPVMNENEGFSYGFADLGDGTYRLDLAAVAKSVGVYLLNFDIVPYKGAHPDAGANVWLCQSDEVVGGSTTDGFSTFS